MAPAAITSFDVDSLSVEQAQHALELIDVILSNPETLSSDLIRTLETQREALDARVRTY